MGNIVSAVVNDSIVHIGAVELIDSLLTILVVGQIGQVGIGLGRQSGQVTAHLILQHILIGQLLHGIQNTGHVVERVSLGGEFRVKVLTCTLRLQHILA